MFHSPFDQPSYKPKAKKKKAKARKKAPAKKKAAKKKVKKKVAKKTKKAAKKKAAECSTCGRVLVRGKACQCQSDECSACEGMGYWEHPGDPCDACDGQGHFGTKKKVAKKRVAKKKATRSRTPNPFNMLKPTAAKNKKVNAAITRAIGYVAWGEVRGSAPNMNFVQDLFYSHVRPTLYEVSETDTETNDAVFTELAAQAVEAIAKAKKKAKKKKAPTRSRPPSSSLGGIRVQCIKEKGKIRVRPVPGQGYPSTKNIQFPKNLRHEGCQYIVDALDDKGTHFRAVGEIRPF